jgi:hypothetical protein
VRAYVREHVALRELCTLFHTLMADLDGVYDPAHGPIRWRACPLPSPRGYDDSVTQTLCNLSAPAVDGQVAEA